MKFFYFLPFFWTCQLVYAQLFSGKVIHVSDGDTITLLDSQKMQHKIRLADIDAPESGQPFGKRAKKELSNLVYGRMISAECRGQDQFERWLCTIFVDDKDVNLYLVQSGYAWVYNQYNQRSDLSDYQDHARQHRLGLWGLPEADIINPSDWRKDQASVQNQVSQRLQSQQRQPDLRCGLKLYCAQMNSCEEALFHLRQCGLVKLDGNGDGVPCEKICH